MINDQGSAQQAVRSEGMERRLIIKIMVFLLFPTNVDIKDGFINLEFKNNEKETSMQQPDLHTVW